MSDTWTEDAYITQPATPNEPFPHTLKEHDTEDAQGGILGYFGTSQGQTTLPAHMGVQHPVPDPAQMDDAQVATLLSSRGVIIVRNSAAKAAFNNRIVDQTQPRQILPYDPNRKIARIWNTSATAVLLGSEGELSNYVGAVALTSLLVAGVCFLPGEGTLPFILEYTAVSELWAIAATAATVGVSTINETYGGQPGIG